MLHPVFDDIKAAADRLRGVANQTPVLRSRTLDTRLGMQVFFKCETFQRMGAFKFRGAYNAISLLSDAQRKAGVVAYSSGNHAQAVALAARLLGAPSTVIMPDDAPVAKMNAAREYGARVVNYNRHTDDRDQMAADLTAREGLTFISPFNDPSVIAGQGTAAMELMEEVGPLDALFVPLGGGGLLSGSLLAAAQLAPACAVYGAEPQASNDAYLSLRAGERVRLPEVPVSIADGARNVEVGDLTFSIMKQYARDVILVPDADLIDAMKFFAERMKIVVEPTGCLGAAAAFAQAKDLQGKRVGVLLSGGNVDIAAYGRYLAS